jgi:hypothetical protein
VWRKISNVREPAIDEGSQEPSGTSWLATGFTLIALFAIGALVHSVQTTGPLLGSSDVSWDRYNPGAQLEIDQAYVDADCNTLQSWLVAAAHADAEIRSTHGAGSIDLIRYLDRALTLASC